MRTTVTLTLSSVVFLVAAGVSSPAWGDGPGVVVQPGDPSGQYDGSPSIGLGASSPGHPGGAGGHAADPGHGGGSSSKPSEGGGEVGPLLPSWCPNASCSADVGPNPHGPPLPLPGGDGYMCALPQNQALCPVPPPAPPGVPPPPAGGPPLPAVLAQQAAGQLRLPLPSPQHSPNLRLRDGRAATLVGEHTWLWTARADWHPYTARVQAGPAWAEVTAAPVRLSMHPGNATPPVSCAGPGTPYQRSFGAHARSPDCDVVYTRSSQGQPGGQTTAGFAISWQVTWRGGIDPAPMEGGVLPVMTSRAQARFAVAEAQALRTH